MAIQLFQYPDDPGELRINLTLTERDWRLLARTMEIFFEGFNSWPREVQEVHAPLYGFFVGELMIDEDGPAPDFTPRSLERFADEVISKEEYQPIVDELIARSGGPEQIVLDIQREVTDPTNRSGAEIRRKIQSLVPANSPRLLTIETDFNLWGFFLGASSSVAAFYTNSPHTQPLWNTLTRLKPALLDIPRPDGSDAQQTAFELRQLTQSLWTQGERQLR